MWRTFLPVLRSLPAPSRPRLVTGYFAGPGSGGALNSRRWAEYSQSESIPPLSTPQLRLNYADLKRSHLRGPRST